MKAKSIASLLLSVGAWMTVVGVLLSLPWQYSTGVSVAVYGYLVLAFAFGFIVLGLLFLVDHIRTKRRALYESPK